MVKICLCFSIDFTYKLATSLGEGGMIWENGIETCIISYMKWVASPGSMNWTDDDDTGCLGLVHWDDPEGWYGKGGGRRAQDGEHCIPVVGSCCYMAKPIQYCKVKKWKNNNKSKTGVSQSGTWDCMHAKLFQSCLTLCDPMDCSPPGSIVHGFLQARILEWVAISFSSAWKWTFKVKSLSCV